MIDLFKIDMETGKSTPQGTASLEGAEFTWSYYDGYYNADNLPAKATRTWTTKTVAEKDSDGTIHYVSRLADSYKVSGDSFYTQDGKNVLPLGTLTVTETKAPNGYLLDGAYMQADGNSEQIKGTYLTQISEDGELAILSGSNQYSVSDKVIRGGVKIQKRDLETKDTKAQGSATLQYTEFNIISLNDSPVLVEGKLYNNNETVKKIQTGIDGIASTSADLLPYGNYRLEESKAPEGYLTDGAKAIDFSITEDGGSNPNTSFDCSGLTQWCYGKAGISLPRTAQAQYDATQHIPLSQAQAGDLVFFHSTYNTSDYVTHVGIYVGNNQMYHAGNSIGYTDLTSAYWQQHIICAGRIKQ